MSYQAQPLKKFSIAEIVISKQNTRDILEFFWGKTSTPINVTPQLTEFAQGLIIEGIRGSKLMSTIEIMWAFGVPDNYGWIRDVAEWVDSKGKHIWFNDNPNKPYIYKNVRNTIALNQKLTKNSLTGEKDSSRGMGPGINGR
jgi:hypothetical protein